MNLDLFIKTIKTPVKIHFSLYIFYIFILYLVWKTNSFNPLLVSFIYLFVYLHELGHIFAAHYYGYGCSKITLSILGGMAHLSSPIEDNIKSIKVSIAGPAVNLLLIIIFVITLMVCNLFEINNSLLSMLIIKFIFYNIIIGVFNLIPVMPLDGGMILHGLVGHFIKNESIAIKIIKYTNISFSFIACIFFWKMEAYTSSVLFLIICIVSFFINLK